MSRDVLYLDVGSVVTTARAVKVSQGSFVDAGLGLCPSPPATTGDLTAAVEPAIEALRRRMGGEGPSFDPEEILVTVSAGGEPRTVCAGVVRGISGESAKRAALSAGATVADLIAVDDGRQDFERVSDLRRQEIAMVVMAGGVDEEIFRSGKHQLISIAKVIADGLPRRRGSVRKVPLVYAASAEGREEVARIFGDTTDIIWADNVRATLEAETLDSAKTAVIDAFIDGIRLDPRFRDLGKFGAPPVWPTGFAAGAAIEDCHRRTGENILFISLDGDAVQVLSGIRGVFTRTVTPVSRVEQKNILQHLPTPRLAHSGGDTLGNWKLHPHVMPATWDELAVFLAFWKEAVREAMADHRNSAIELRGIHRQRQISETFQVNVSGGDTLVRMERIGKIIFGGYLSRLLSPASIMSLAVDAADPSGFTEVLVDPYDALQIAGALSREGFSATPEDMLRPVGLLVSPGKNEERVTTKRASIQKGQALETLPVQPDEIVVVPVEGASALDVVLDPPNNKVDFGEGDGRKIVRKVRPGFPAIYLDGRARNRARAERPGADVQKWYRSMKVFPDDVTSGWAGGKQ